MEGDRREQHTVRCGLQEAKARRRRRVTQPPRDTFARGRSLRALLKSFLERVVDFDIISDMRVQAF